MVDYMSSRAKTKTKVAPTHYPFLPFHGLRCAQFVSSLIVGAIMFYFIYHLEHDHWFVPWTFIWLTVGSLLTWVFLTISIVLHCCCGLNPRLNLLFNSLLFIIWATGFGLLSWWSSGTLTHVCNIDNWHDDTGIMVCRMYKALFAFAMLGFVSTLLALILDIYVFRRATARGKYNPMMDPDADVKRGLPGFGYSDRPVPMGNFNAQPKQAEPEQGGYGVPEEQFEYDTAYYGGHAERVLS